MEEIIDSETQEQTSVGGKIFITALIIFLIFAVSFVLDMGCNRSMIMNNYINSYKACDFKVPEGYAIVQNVEGEYAVQVFEKYMGDDLYLKDDGTTIHTMFSSIATPALFYDSCHAKGFLINYIKQTSHRFIKK